MLILKVPMVPSVINIPWTRLITFLMKPGMRDDAVIEFLPNHVSIFQFLGKMVFRYFWFANMAKKETKY